ncbi:hypothetical protein INS49_010345 [Diaporthe citri]|uniref:uncharacterized protein n=1 Tax=Diaporthe citri TaxID=83186 RepID=UPI001C81ED80|nr:uncharacterized protein INS49_010345 [Diaporthe citri]KAG6362116.1 hypothetical protein INS49_010345 [Diaporthe citri]
MTLKSKACPEGEGASYQQNRQDAVQIVPSREADVSHQKEKQVAGRQRQAEIDPDGQRRQKTMKSQDNTAVVDVHDANNMPVNVRPMNSNTWQGASVVVESHHRTGWITRSDPSTAGGQKLWQILAEILAKRSHTNEVIAYMAPTIDESRASSKPSDLCAMTVNELELAIGEANLKIRHSRLRESVGQLISDRDEAAADIGREAPRAGPLTGSEDEQHPGWLELLDFMELGKSRFLIFDESQEYCSLQTLFLSFARMANIAKRRERFEEYLVEAPREWYCFTTVCKNGYQNEGAMASEKNCDCPQNEMACLQVRIRRGRLRAFDFRFR